MTFTELASVPSDPLAPFTDQLRLAVAAYLARFKGSSREHTESDLRCYLTWCAERGLDPLAARRPHLELYIRWMQEIRRFKPSTVSRRFSVTAGFYRTCVLDGVLQHSPAEHVRRPAVPPESPTSGFTHLQFEALLTAAREYANPHDFALVAMLGLLGLRISEATSANIADLGEEHGHRVLRVCGKGTKIVLVPLPPAVGRAIDRVGALSACAPGRCFRDVHVGSGCPGVGPIPGGGCCLALGERRAGQERLVGVACAQALPDPCYQFGLGLPQQRPRRQADPPA
jgi:integrase/recombinase XerD